MPAGFTDSITQFILRINKFILNPIIILLFGLAVLIFVWGIVRYLMNSDNETERARAQQHMIYGVLGIFIMVAVYGILNILVNTFGIELPH